MPSSRLECDHRNQEATNRRLRPHAHRYRLFFHLTPETVCSLARSTDAEGPSESVYIFFVTFIYMSGR